VSSCKGTSKTGRPQATCGASIWWAKQRESIGNRRAGGRRRGGEIANAVRRMTCTLVRWI
jgi:hypothetical protein